MRQHVERQLLGDWSRLFGYAMSLARDRDRASDLLQQAAMQALTTQRPPHDVRAIRAWLFQIVRHVWIDRFRQEAVRADYAASAFEDTPVWNHDDRVISEIGVRQGLALIDPAFREIVELVDIQGFSYAEAAEILHVPLGTVMSRLSRARLALLECLGGTVRSVENEQRRTV